MVVVSARAGVTDRLQSEAEARRPRSTARLDRWLRDRHTGLGDQGTVERRIVRDLLDGTRGPLTGEDRELLLSQGERLAARWLAERLDRAGIPATALESDRIGLRAESGRGGARVLLSESRTDVGTALRRAISAGIAPVVTGYIGRSRSGKVTTLGRGGSDYSAVAIGVILGANRVELVKRRWAVSTADPRIVGNAQRISRLSYADARTLAESGASVLHPRSIAPAQRAGLTIRVVALRHPRTITEIGAGNRTAGRTCIARSGPMAEFRVRSDRRVRKGDRRWIRVALGRAGIRANLWPDEREVIPVLVEWEVRQSARVALQVADRKIGRPSRRCVVTALGEPPGSVGLRRHVAVVSRYPWWSPRPGLLRIRVPDAVAVATVRGVHRHLTARLAPRLPGPTTSSPERLLPRPSSGVGGPGRDPV